MTMKDVITRLKKRNEILEKRCERYRAIIRNEVDLDKFTDYATGFLSHNDIRYLYELTELNDDEIGDLIGAKPKLPLGVVSREIWDRKRQEELAEAMGNYLEAGKKFPKEWLDEYNEISDRWEEKKK